LYRPFSVAVQLPGASVYTGGVSGTTVADNPPMSIARDRRLLGARLREARKRRGIGVRELGRQTDCSASLISQIELGKIAPSVSTLYTLTSSLGVSIDSLFVSDETSPEGAAPDRATLQGATPDGTTLEEATLEAATLEAATLAGAQPDGASANGGRPGEGQRPEGPARAVSATGEPAPMSAEASLVQRRHSRPHISLQHGVRWERLNPLPEMGAEFLEVTYVVGGGSRSDDQGVRHNGREYGLVLEGELSVQIGFESYILQAGDSVAFDSTIPHRFWNSGNTPVRAIWFELKSVGIPPDQPAPTGGWH
jgi:transcriptional regulator with XRE-family HTH domain/mannose-6-phosphate isomerase-like protein (cupin superfamily)